MKFLATLGGLALLFYAMVHFHVHVSHTAISILVGLSVGSIVLGRQLEAWEKQRRARGPASVPPARRSRAAPIPATVQTTAEAPLVISHPALGLVNLMGEAGDAALFDDLRQLGDLFPRNVHVGQKIPRCNVLFLYCALEPSGRIAGQPIHLRDAIKAAGAQIVVVAAEVRGDLVSNPAFMGYMSSSRQAWPANIVFTLNRNGEKFGVFFRHLFTRMRAGASMPEAWVRLAPQGPNQATDGPATVVLLEGGHVKFGQTPAA